MDGQLRLIAGNANRPVAQEMAERISRLRDRTTELARADVTHFNDNESAVTIHDNVRGEDVFIIQPTSRPANEHLMELLIIIDAVRRSSAYRITAVMPYFGYARQDRRLAARTPITAKLVANLLTMAGADRVLTLDLHAGQIQGFFDIPTDNLYAEPVFALHMRRFFGDVSQLVIVSPDVGGVVRARELAKRLKAGLAIVDKEREVAGVVSKTTLIGEVAGRHCVLVDDLVDTAGTLCAAAELLLDNGAKSVRSYVSHGVLSGPALDRIAASSLDAVVITDSIAPPPEVVAAAKIEVIPIAPLLAQAVLNVANDTSVSSLFREAQIAPLYADVFGAP